jgi:lysophospholipase L1-like esterase
LGPVATRAARAALLLSGILLGTAAAEGILRARGVIYEATRSHPDPALGYTLRPGLKGHVRDADHSYNSRGIRDREYPDRPSRGVKRLLCVGDSIAYAQVTRLERTFPKRLEADLNTSGGGTRYEVINGGVAGYNACQEEAFYRDVGSSYHPDLVVWQYCLNDPEEARDPMAPSGLMPPSWERALRDRLVLWSFLRVEYRGVMQMTGLMDRRWDASDPAYARRVFDMYGEAGRKQLDAAWACVARASRAIREDGADVLLVVFPFAMQMAGGLEATDEPQREIEGRCRRDDIACLDLLPAFRDSGDRGLYLTPDFVHLSDAGHQAAADAIAREVPRMRQPATGPAPRRLVY